MKQPQRIHVFGASGSGTTTLGKAVSAKLGCKHLDADDYFWQPTNPPYQQITPKPERIQNLSAEAPCSNSWVLSGCIAGWGEWIKPRLTLSVFIELDQQTRMQRLIARDQSEFRERIEPGGDLHESHLKFVEWAYSYDTAEPPVRSYKLHEQWIEEMLCPVITVNSKESVSSLVTEVIDAIA